MFSNKEDKVLALPLAVGNKIDHPAWRVAWAVVWIVGKMLAAVAK